MLSGAEIKSSVGQGQENLLKGEAGSGCNMTAQSFEMASVGIDFAGDFARNLRTMNRITSTLIAGCTFAAVLCLAPFAGAAEDMTAKTEPAKAEYELQPIFTRYAKTSDKITFSSTFKAYRDAELQEAENLDALGVDAEILVPFAKRFQLRLNVPIYTAGNARLIAPPHENLTVEGWGGTFDFATAQFEWQFLNQADHGLNMSIGGGGGERLNWLDTSIADRYNHKGVMALGQVRVDRQMNDWFTLVGNLGVRHYFISDDLNPAGNAAGDVFTLAEGFVAGVFNPWDNKLVPVLELIYTGDFGKYNSVLVVPEVIWPISRHFELKAGGTFGLTSNGERVGARVQAVLRF